MEELELGLTLRAKQATDFSDASNCRILTAKDFPMVNKSIATPISSSSSVSSSSVSADDVGGTANPTSHGLVGWPPVRAFRMNNMANQHKDHMYESNSSVKKKKIHSSSLNQKAMGSKDLKGHKNIDGSRFIKVNMDGDPIGRKVDLNAHESYKTLALALEIMFYKPTSHYGMNALKLLDGSIDYALTYEDKDGDWMLVGDVPWSMFLDTVKRLRIMKVSEASGQKLRLSFSEEDYRVKYRVEKEFL